MKALKYFLYSLGLFVFGAAASSLIYYLKYKESFLTKYQKLRQNNLYVPGIDGNIDFTWHINKFIMPGAGFLSDMVVFNAAVFAMLIPLSYLIMDRADKRYGTAKVSTAFFSIWEAKALPFLLAFSVFYCIVLKFFIREMPYSDLWAVSAWISLLIFAAGLWASLNYLIKMRLFLSDAGYTLNRLLQEAWDAVSKTRVRNRFSKFAEALQSTGEILSREVRAHNSKNLVKILPELLQLTSCLLKKNDSATAFTVEDNDEPSRAGDASVANFQTALLLPIEQIAKIHSAASLCNNLPVIAIVESSGMEIFAAVSSCSRNRDVIRRSLEIFSEMSGRMATPENIFLWFTGAVFRNAEFSVEYMDILNESLACSLSNSLLKGGMETIEAFFKELHTLPGPPPFSIEPYNQALIELNRKKYIEMSDEFSVYSTLEALQRRALEIRNIKMLNEWSEAFNEFHNKVSSYYKKDKIRRIEEIKTDILENVSSMAKGIYLLRIIFNLFVYSLYAGNQALMKTIWQAIGAIFSSSITAALEPEIVVKMYIEGDFRTEGTIFINDTALWQQFAKISLLLFLVKMAQSRKLLKTETGNVKPAYLESTCKDIDTIIEEGKVLMSGNQPLLAVIENSDLIAVTLQTEVIPFLISIKHSIKEII
ncbi:MAG: hypothetical protein H7844_02920 [Nitrospirae bacterium YQR-1]